MMWRGRLLAVATSIAAVFVFTINVNSKQLTFVRTITVSHQDYIERISLSGEVVSRDISNLSFLVSGRMSTRFVDVGDLVNAGDTLALLDPQEQQADLVAARASVRAAEAQLLSAQLEFERSQSLLAQGFTTRSLFDLTQTTLRLAEGTLEAANAQLEWSEDALHFTELKAPESGIITARFAEEGQIMQVAQTVFTLAENGHRDAIFDVYESILFGQPTYDTVAISLIENPEVSAECNVREVSPSIDRLTGTVRIKCGIVDTPGALTLGSAVLGTVVLAPTSSIILPWNTIASDDGLPAVWVLDPETQTVALRQVEITQYETGRIILGSGVEDGELIVTHGTKFLREGMQVEVVAP